MEEKIFLNVINKQGVIHLAPSDYAFVTTILRHGLEEQNRRRENFSLIKQHCLELLLLEIKQAIDFQREKFSEYSPAHQKIIAEVLIYIEKNLAENLDFNDLAEKYSFSQNYFRKIFRDVTGFSPVSYVNRLRVVRAYEYIQKEHLTVGEAAARVGIYDLNYFSRLFKKIMGTSPTHF